MKLVIIHNRSDGDTWWATDTISIERESEEALLVELEDWANKNDSKTLFRGWNETGICYSTILGKNLDCSIAIMTLDSWWEQGKIE